MFGPLGFPEVVFILILALLIFGPKRLPEIGRTLGKGMAQFRRATTDLRRTLESEIALEEDVAPRPSRPAGLPAPRPVPAAEAVQSEAAPVSVPEAVPEGVADPTAEPAGSTAAASSGQP